MFIFYDILFIFLFVVWLPFYGFRALFRKKYQGGLLQRFGVFPRQLDEKIKSGVDVWLHAVSVGEVLAARPILTALRKEFPSLKIAISTITRTGNDAAHSLAGDNDIVVYLPLDISFIIKKVLRKFRPKVFLMMETELWPNLIRTLSKFHIPVALLNARISPRSFKGYKKIRFIVKGAFRRIDFLAMQTQKDAQRAIALGAPPDRVKVTGNTKFDLAGLENVSRQEKQRLRDSLGLNEEAQLFVCGSTHKGEEEILLAVYRDLIADYPDLRLLIAPRHLERIESIEKLLSGLEISSVRSSRLSAGKQSADVIILDKMGVLRSLYSIATLVFVGGSLIPRGGQSVIEPAAFAKPVIFGPYVFNFQEAVDCLLEQEAAIMVQGRNQLLSACREILNSPEKRVSLGQKAKDVVEKLSGATERNMELIKDLLFRVGYAMI